MAGQPPGQRRHQWYRAGPDLVEQRGAGDGLTLPARGRDGEVAGERLVQVSGQLRHAGQAQLRDGQLQRAEQPFGQQGWQRAERVPHR
ncbi:hypothetical protein RB614_28830 [Phytohabitans sp. ZYX-F-186]|uniref:Uncharacterized protein n=1 Tax=Phytohabitans maris TaxID=3071409 RepID=A0ABU0ZRH2_9ACTN|nr:hypothetical protein [Phytohabitans sp. ZYX-F-186]MDQ7908542.1 hypothetical protein [Phytohabitans sp. ZYX-F-186]